MPYLCNNHFLKGMNYFYETQPNPNPAAFYLHQMPESWHSFETFGNHVVELILPLFAIIPLRYILDPGSQWDQIWQKF